jgi:transcriptional regulator with XRE-family HTH domain
VLFVEIDKTFKEGKMPDSNPFPGRLKSAREMRKLTQIELGTKANLPSTSVAHFEAGSRKPSFDNLRKLAEALEVTTDYLLGRMDEPTMSGDADVAFRDIGKLSNHNREILKDLIQSMAEKEQKK